MRERQLTVRDSCLIFHIPLPEQNPSTKVVGSYFLLAHHFYGGDQEFPFGEKSLGQNFR